MARGRVRQTTTRTTRSRQRRTGTGYRVCNMCHGTGRVKKK